MEDQKKIATVENPDALTLSHRAIMSGQAEQLMDLMIAHSPQYTAMINQNVPEDVAKRGIAKACFEAVAMGANPFNGDLHIWASEGKKKNPDTSKYAKKWIGNGVWTITTTPHYKFMLKYANSIDRVAIMSSNGRDFRQMTAEERIENDLNSNDIGIIISGYRVSSMRELTDIGATFLQAEQRVMAYGIGIVRYDEITTDKWVNGKNTGEKIKGDSVKARSHIWRATIRAYRDLLTRLGLYPTAGEMQRAVQEKEARYIERKNQPSEPLGFDLFGDGGADDVPELISAELDESPVNRLRKLEAVTINEIAKAFDLDPEFDYEGYGAVVEKLRGYWASMVADLPITHIVKGNENINKVVDRLVADCPSCNDDVIDAESETEDLENPPF